jgi:hypothetical protein
MSEANHRVDQSALAFSVKSRTGPRRISLHINDSALEAAGESDFAPV